MAAKVPEMSADFARWYAEAFLDEGATRLARWKSVTEIAAGANHLGAEVLVRLAFASKAPASGGGRNEDLLKVHTDIIALISAGKNFDPVRDIRELQILAATSLVRMFATKPDAPLAVITAGFGSSRNPELPMDLGGLAKRAVADLSEKQHARIDPASLKIEAPAPSFKLSEQGEQALNVQVWKLELESLRDDAAAGLASLTSELNAVISKVMRRVRLGDEELQMLWWLTGGASRETGEAFGAMNVAAKPLILAKELGKMTTVSPGPASIGAMFAQAGLGEDEIKVADAVNALDAEWAARFSKQKTISPVTTPIHYAIEKRTELDSSEAWQAGWAALTELSADVSLPAVGMAEQFYREHLFLNVSE